MIAKLHSCERSDHFVKRSRDLSMLCTCDSSTRAFHVWFEGRSTLGPSLSKFIPHFFLAKSCETYSALEDLQQDAWVSPSDAP